MSCDFSVMLHPRDARHRWPYRAWIWLLCRPRLKRLIRPHSAILRDGTTNSSPSGRGFEEISASSPTRRSSSWRQSHAPVIPGAVTTVARPPSLNLPLEHPDAQRHRRNRKTASCGRAGRTALSVASPTPRAHRSVSRAGCASVRSAPCSSEPSATPGTTRSELPQMRRLNRKLSASPSLLVPVGRDAGNRSMTPLRGRDDHRGSSQGS